MTKLNRMPGTSGRIAAVAACGALLLLAAPVCAFAQADAPLPNISTDDPNAYTGVRSDLVQYDPSNSLAYVNANANSVQYTDRLHGPLSLAIEARGAYTDNVFDSSSNGNHAGFFAIGVPVGYRWSSATTAFITNYRIDGYIYPGNSAVNSTSQVYLQQWKKNLSSRTYIYWNTTAARVLDLGQYLPTLIPIGGIGVSTPGAAQATLQNSYLTTNAITSLGLIHEITNRDLITYDATAGWVEDSQQQAAAGQSRLITRGEPIGGDVQYNHLLTPKTAVGAEVTGLFIRGLAPVGHGTYAAVEAVYKHNFTEHLGMRLLAGPLFTAETSTGQPSSTGVSYAATAAVDYTLPYSRISVNYSRAVQLQYVEAPTTANQVSALFDSSITRTIDLTVTGRYINTDSTNITERQQLFALSARLDRYFGNKFSLFVEAGRYQRSEPQVATQPDFSYGRDEASVGLHYQFGNALERQGAPKQ